MKLYNEDCLETLKNINDSSIDLIVTDCPYHIVQGGCSTGTYGNDNGIFAKTPSGVLNRNIKLIDENVEYTRQGKLFKHNDIKFKEWLPELYRALKPNKHIYIYINSRNLKELQQDAEDSGFIFQQLIIWDKGNATPNRYYLNAYECILMLRKGKAKNINNMGTKNIIRIKNIIGNKTHPTEKPVELNEILIKNSSNEGELILDPFMGTGSSGVACKNLNRNFIGIEIDEKYFEIAKNRIEGD